MTEQQLRQATANVKKSVVPARTLKLLPVPRIPVKRMEIEVCQQCLCWIGIESKYDPNGREICSKCWEKMKADSPDDIRHRNVELCRKHGVGSLFCRDGKLPNFDDDGLRQRIAKNPLPKGALSIYGEVGSHKTHLLAARTMDAVRRGYTARLINWYRFCLDVRATYQDGAKETVSGMVDRLVKLNYLAIDDLGLGRDEKETLAGLHLAYVLLNERYLDEKQTDVTSNLAPDQLEDRFDARIGRRLRESCTPYQMFARVPPEEPTQ